MMSIYLLYVFIYLCANTDNYSFYQNVSPPHAHHRLPWTCAASAAVNPPYSGPLMASDTEQQQQQHQHQHQPYSVIANNQGDNCGDNTTITHGNDPVEDRLQHHQQHQEALAQY